MGYFLLVGWVAPAVLGQNARGPAAQPPPGNITSTNSIISTNSAVAPNAAAGGGTVMTNASGGSFTVQQLGAQLQTLRRTVDQTLPMLNTFNQQVSAQSPGSTIAGAVRNIFSGNKNQGQNGGGVSQDVTNVLSALGALVNTNRQTQIDPNTLATLQKDLQTVQRDLQNLNLSGTTTQPVSPGLSPTGR